MVQIIPRGEPSTKEKFGQAFSNLGKSVGESIVSYQQQKEQKRLQDEEYQQQNDIYSQLTGRNLSRDPKIREKEIEYALKGEFESKKIGEKLKGEKNKFEDETLKNLAPLEGALGTIDEMRKIRKRGNLGLGSSVWAYFGGDTAKDKGQYEQLGKSLIQYATNIPIRNKLEFETLAERLYDANITDAEAEGVLDAMENIVKRSMSEFHSEKNEKTPTFIGSLNAKKERPPITEAWE